MRKMEIARREALSSTVQEPSIGAAVAVEAPSAGHLEGLLATIPFHLFFQDVAFDGRGSDQLDVDQDSVLDPPEREAQEQEASGQERPTASVKLHLESWCLIFL